MSEHQEQNKMGQNNLATVFGPNVLRPSSADTDPTDLAKGTLDVMSQVGIFLWFLKFCSLQLPEDPQLMRRLDPNKNVEVAPALGHEDRLIWYPTMHFKSWPRSDDVLTRACTVKVNA